MTRRRQLSGVIEEVGETTIWILMDGGRRVCLNNWDTAYSTEELASAVGKRLTIQTVATIKKDRRTVKV